MIDKVLVTRLLRDYYNEVVRLFDEQLVMNELEELLIKLDEKYADKITETILAVKL